MKVLGLDTATLTSGIAVVEDGHVLAEGRHDASGRTADRLPAASLQIHSAAGWTSLGSLGSRAVPAAPQTVTLLQARAPVASYDAVRVGGAPQRSSRRHGRISGSPSCVMTMGSTR